MDKVVLAGRVITSKLQGQICVNELLASRGSQSCMPDLTNEFLEPKDKMLDLTNQKSAEMKERESLRDKQDI